MESEDVVSKKEQGPKKIQLPISMEEEVGLGDLVKRFTTFVGVKPCGGCQKRAQWLNQRAVFSGRQGGQVGQRNFDYPDE